MPFTSGSLLGLFDGQATGDNTNSAFNQCNSTSPNLAPKNDLLQILSPGGAVLLRVNSAGTVTTNVAAGVATTSTVVATIQMTAAQFNGLPATPTAAQITGAVWPPNINNPNSAGFNCALFSDIFQVGSFSPSTNVAGGGFVEYRLDFAGVARTS